MVLAGLLFALIMIANISQACVAHGIGCPIPSDQTTQSEIEPSTEPVKPSPCEMEGARCSTTLGIIGIAHLAYMFLAPLMFIFVRGTGFRLKAVRSVLAAALSILAVFATPDIRETETHNLMWAAFFWSSGLFIASGLATLNSVWRSLFLVCALLAYFASLGWLIAPWSDNEINFSSVIFFNLITFAIMGTYMLPTLIAGRMAHPKFLRIATYNCFLGWTIVFWILPVKWLLEKTAVESKGEATLPPHWHSC
jgi:hypothetical protein